MKEMEEEVERVRAAANAQGDVSEVSEQVRAAEAIRLYNDKLCERLVDQEARLEETWKQNASLVSKNQNLVAANKHLSDLAQQLQMDLQWAAGMKSEGSEPPTVLRKRYGKGSE